ncbi:GatB/YqeY domain-containing protein [Photobacterium sp. DNB23_23_1]|uniref:GatB/YqeY domain-containing protein n=1 Tax=Photobacterium pectinilyticum TaxID=2906793 RepID=A0ABT1N2S3_9GAMM|nr:GatB/YqeY domain-containing protein [Photobacterium sp. ZSDE20]MCQ1059033.1 GatB/YqeY domain-containing protein [Photobacterium sp. ZSDE20]MDD1824117.1 GatB/YqeY domain-containing protein [Photobacterium sp. ZSDE20]
MTLIERLKDEQKTAMKAKDKPRLGTIRLVMAAIKQREVDEKITLTDDDVLAVLTKMVKQRRDSVAQYEAANRQDLADVELAEITVLEEFMPQPLTDDEVAALLDEAIATTGAASMQDMGKLMGVLKPQVQGRADMGKVSQLVKAKLG